MLQGVYKIIHGTRDSVTSNMERTVLYLGLLWAPPLPVLKDTLQANGILGSCGSENWFIVVAAIVPHPGVMNSTP